MSFQPDISLLGIYLKEILKEKYVGLYQEVFLFLFLPMPVACETLVPQSGVKLEPSA